MATKELLKLEDVSLKNTGQLIETIITHQDIAAPKREAFYTFYSALLDLPTDPSSYLKLSMLAIQGAKILPLVADDVKDALMKVVNDAWSLARDAYFKENPIEKVGAVTKWDICIADVRLHAYWAEANLLLDAMAECEKELTTQYTLADFQTLLKKKTKVIKKELSAWEWAWFENEVLKRCRVIGNRVTRSYHEDFGQWLRSVRKAKGYSLTELEELTGISASYVNRIENGKRKQPSFAIAEKLAVALDIPKTEFLSRLGADIPDAPSSQSVIDWLIVQDAQLGELSLNRDQKQALVDLLKTIEKASWTPESKMEEGLRIIHYVDTIKRGK